MNRWRTANRNAESPLSWERIRAAPVTTILCAAAALVSAGYMVAAPQTWEETAAWGYYPGIDIWGGTWWPLWTTALLHGDLLHLGFNLYWMWFFGSHLEPYLGRKKFSALCLVGIFVCSCAELGATSYTGIGLSGLIYVFFGYAWLGPRDGTLDRLMAPHTVWLLGGWLFVCLVLTWTELYPVANAAHFAGVAFGVCLGIARRSHPRAGWAGAATLVAASIGVLLWCPWSVDWLGAQAYRAFREGDEAAGLYYVEAILRIDPEDEWALTQRARGQGIPVDPASAVHVE